MINRVSTAGQHSAAISQILKQQTALAKTQQQVASGKRIQTPADDPIGSTRVLAMEQQQSQLEQYGRNADILASRLGVGEQALSDLGNLLQRARDLTVQAGNGALDDVSLKSIATELKSRAQELVDLANRRDTNGEYLFSGFSTQVQPFSRTARRGQLCRRPGRAAWCRSAPRRSWPTASPGDRAFMAVPEGNGTFTVATGVHTGTGIVDTGQVVGSVRLGRRATTPSNSRRRMPGACWMAPATPCSTAAAIPWPAAMWKATPSPSMAYR